LSAEVTRAFDLVVSGGDGAEDAGNQANSLTAFLAALSEAAVVVIPGLKRPQFPPRCSHPK
jgi:hypothetical protein